MRLKLTLTAMILGVSFQAFGLGWYQGKEVDYTTSIPSKIKNAMVSVLGNGDSQGIQVCDGVVLITGHGVYNRSKKSLSSYLGIFPFPFNYSTGIYLEETNTVSKDGQVLFNRGLLASLNSPYIESGDDREDYAFVKIRKGLIKSFVPIQFANKQQLIESNSVYMYRNKPGHSGFDSEGYVTPIMTQPKPEKNYENIIKISSPCQFYSNNESSPLVRTNCPAEPGSSGSVFYDENSKKIVGLMIQEFESAKNVNPSNLFDTTNVAIPSSQFYSDYKKACGLN